MSGATNFVLLYFPRDHIFLAIYFATKLCNFTNFKMLSLAVVVYRFRSSCVDQKLVCSWNHPLCQRSVSLRYPCFSGIFDEIMWDCCDSCWKLNLTSEVSRQTVTAGTIPSYIDIVLPYSSSDERTKVQGMHFVSLIKNPSVVYITKKESARVVRRKFIAAVWNAWPVLIMGLLLSVVSGVVLWFLVS